MTSEGPAPQATQDDRHKHSAFRQAQGDGPTVLQAVLAVAVLIGSTYLGHMHVLDGQTVGVIYVAVLGHVFREVGARRKNGNDREV